MGEPDIDLYADDLDGEFDGDSEFNHGSNEDLYDDVISPHGEDANGERRPSSRDSASPSRHRSSSDKRAAAYIGNLTWWTTDQDILDGIHNIGVNDVLEIKFFDNRANGQSKGFCFVSLGSENSLRLVMEKFSKKTIHSQTPVVTPYTRQNLHYFETQSRKGRHDSTPERYSHERERDPQRSGPGDRMRNRTDAPQQRGPPPPHTHMQHPAPRGPPPPQYRQSGAPWMSAPPPQMHPMSVPLANRPGLPPMVTSTNVPPPGLHAQLHRPAGPPPMNVRVPPPTNLRGPPPHVGMRQAMAPDPRAPTQHEWERPNVSHPPPQIGIPPHLGLPNRLPPPVPASHTGLPSVLPPGPHAPSPHVNPMFLQQAIPPSGIPTTQASDPYSRPPPAQFPEYRTASEGAENSTSSLTDTEFQEIMSRNQSVSSSAIMRAVSDASSGDYASAIETLVTAISLIKQCKIADDDRCKILISSLQDTLHGIESKSYGSRSKDRPRSRERERSRERSSRRDKSSRRDRSRSRDREYRDRSRERDRYHDDRYRDKDRDHDRDRRSSRH